MNNLEQHVQTDYYQILGVSLHSSLNDLCRKSFSSHTATAILLLPTTPPSSTIIPTKHIASFLRRLRPSMSSTIVLHPRRSGEEKDI